MRLSDDNVCCNCTIEGSYLNAQGVNRNVSVTISYLFVKDEGYCCDLIAQRIQLEKYYPCVRGRHYAHGSVSKYDCVKTVYNYISTYDLTVDGQIFYEFFYVYKGHNCVQFTIVMSFRCRRF